MATTIVFRNTLTNPRATPKNVYRDMLVANPLVTGTSVVSDNAGDNIEREFLATQGTPPIRFWSERVATQVTISGQITFSMRVIAVSAGFTGRLRAYLYKITAGGSAIETLIGQADAAADVAATTTYSFNFTPSASFIAVPGERFICRVTVMSVSGSFGTGTVSLSYGGGATASTCSVTFTETVAFKANGVTFFSRSTSSGIGNFYDLSESRGAGPAVTGVVNTVAGGTEIQWTRTAGGTVLEWISPRIKAPGWTVDDINLFGSPALAPYAFESNANANCTVRGKIFRRKPDGTETLVATFTYTTAEMGVTSFRFQMLSSMGVLNNATNFAEDDRIVVRYYIVPFTALTMGGNQTCTLQYDAATSTQGDTQFIVLDSPDFKASGDPSGTSSVPGAMPTMGVGN